MPSYSIYSQMNTTSLTLPKHKQKDTNTHIFRQHLIQLFSPDSLHGLLHFHRIDNVKIAVKYFVLASCKTSYDNSNPSPQAKKIEQSTIYTQAYILSYIFLDSLHTNRITLACYLIIMQWTMSSQPITGRTLDSMLVVFYLSSIYMQMQQTTMLPSGSQVHYNLVCTKRAYSISCMISF